MDADRESLLIHSERTGPQTINLFGNSLSIRVRRNVLLLALSMLIATCLTIYLYLNLIAINGSQSNPAHHKPLSRRKPMLDHESIFNDSGASMLKLSDLLAHCIVALEIAGREVVKSSLLSNKKLQNVGSKGQTLEGVDDVVTDADMKSHNMILNTIKDSYRRLKIVSEEDTTTAFENTNRHTLPINRTKFATMLRENLHHLDDASIGMSSLISLHDTLVWIDPLDATKEYSENLTDYVTLMACIVHKSVPIAGIIHKPFKNNTYWSVKDENTGRYHHSPDLRESLNGRDKYRESDKIRIIVSRSHAGDVASSMNSLFTDGIKIISAGGSGYKTIELIEGRADAYVHMTHIKKWDICAPHAIINSISEGKMTDLDGGQITFGDPKEKVVTKGLVASFNWNILSKIHRKGMSGTVM